MKALKHTFMFGVWQAPAAAAISPTTGPNVACVRNRAVSRNVVVVAPVPAYRGLSPAVPKTKNVLTVAPWSVETYQVPLRKMAMSSFPSPS